MINILFLHAGAEMYGADKVMLDLIKNLDKKKYNPYVILPTEGVLVDALKKEHIKVKVIPYPIMRRKYFNPKGIIQYICDFVKYSKKIERIAKKKDIHLIHTNTAAVVEGCYLSRKLNIPQLWSVHEIIMSPKIIFKFTSWMISKFAQFTVTDSNAVRNHLLSSGYFKKASIKVIYNGVDSSYFKPENSCDYLYDEWNIPRNAKIVGMMGRVNSWKGQADFLKASNIVMKQYPDVYTIFVGSAFEGEEWREEELQRHIQESPYRDRIVNCGYRTDSKGIYSLYDIFVLPSTNPDPLPTVVLEAMATGKPIVGYRHGGICEMVKEGYNGLLAEVNNPEDLAAQIISLLEDDEKRIEMGRCSRDRLLNNFSLDAYINNYSEMYNFLIERKRKG